MEELDYIFVK